MPSIATARRAGSIWRARIQSSSRRPRTLDQAREGLLVVFPSYLWHGTEPLCEARARMSVGYDILPAR